MSASANFPYLLGLAAFLFSVGALGVLIRRNPIVVFMCIELMLNAVNIVFVAYGRFLNSEEGQVFAFMVIVVAAAEVVVGLALITQVFRIGRELDVDDLDEMSDWPVNSTTVAVSAVPDPALAAGGRPDQRPRRAAPAAQRGQPGGHAGASSRRSWSPASCSARWWARRTAPSR